jgi:hypothetical protein
MAPIPGAFAFFNLLFIAFYQNLLLLLLVLPLQVRSATPCDAMSCFSFYVVQRHVTPCRVSPST